MDRLRVARKALAQIRPIIEGVQGTMPPDEVVTRVRAAALEGVPQGAATMKAPLPTTARPATALGNYSGQIHGVMFYLLLAMGLIGCLEFFVRHVALVIAGTLISLGTSVTAAIALVRQYGSGLSRALQRLTWMVLTFMIVLWGISYVMFFLFAIRSGGAPAPEWQYMQMLAEMSPLDSPLHMALSLAVIAISWLLGGLGLVCLHRFWQARERATLEGVIKTVGQVWSPAFRRPAQEIPTRSASSRPRPPEGGTPNLRG